MAKTKKTKEVMFPASAVLEFARVVAVGLLDDGLDRDHFCCLATLQQAANRRAESRLKTLEASLKSAGAK